MRRLLAFIVLGGLLFTSGCAHRWACHRHCRPACCAPACPCPGDCGLPH